MDDCDTNMIGKRVRVLASATSDLARQHAGRVGTIQFVDTTRAGLRHYRVAFEHGKEVMLQPKEVEVLE
jgi:hypothetical protein